MALLGAGIVGLADRHRGIGFDQAIVFEPAHTPDTVAFYRIFNADGGEVEQCGNGARCVAALVARRLGHGPGELLMDSPGGLVHARVGAAGLVSVSMGVPDFAPAALPFEAAADAPAHRLEVDGASAVGRDRSLTAAAIAVVSDHSAAS